MQDTQNNELFSDISTEESATINGGCGCDGYRRGRSVYYDYGRPRYYYDGYGYSRSVSYGHRGGYGYRRSSYRRGGCY
ncbi:MAG: hypothetical protein F6K23_10525 [Okeania sp. SIO2C9]|uniref:hypothetical protein n=1 Tax=Okeania sp. SIO2C9 TaxID=2607791 RepID=UPI0013C255B4|nr:hypothetical protein [Okeania sp. SIO2C9]NEQ73462.1 hypothetical protein [Okeania sp. SIO2C9]